MFRALCRHICQGEYPGKHPLSVIGNNCIFGDFLASGCHQNVSLGALQILGSLVHTGDVNGSVIFLITLPAAAEKPYISASCLLAGCADVLCHLSRIGMGGINDRVCLYAAHKIFHILLCKARMGNRHIPAFRQQLLPVLRSHTDMGGYGLAVQKFRSLTAFRGACKHKDLTHFYSLSASPSCRRFPLSGNCR